MKVRDLAKKLFGSDQMVGILLGASYVAWLVLTTRSLGFSRDEGFYFYTASEYARWFELLFSHPAAALQQSAIDPIWEVNHEHPALMKSLFSLSWLFLYKRHPIFAEESTAFRFPAMVMAGIAIWVIYLLGARAYGRRAGAMAALLLGLMPNLFFHAHLACFDVPIAAFWLLCIYAYFRSGQEGGLVWPLLSGILCGLALLTKHNAWMLPAVFLPHAFVAASTPAARWPAAGRQSFFASILAMASLGPALFVALWPWLWHRTLPRLTDYVNFHLHHPYYNIEFLHRNYFGPPSPKLYVPVMIAATVPGVTILLFFIGLGGRLKPILGCIKVALGNTPRSTDPKRAPAGCVETDFLLLLAAAVPLLIFFWEKTPIFGGTKHWLPAYPFLCIFAGRGFEHTASALQQVLSKCRLGLRALAEFGLAASVVGPALLITVQSHPFGISTYTPLIGGTIGGARLGLCRQFWGYSTQGVSPWLNTHAKAGASVFVHDTARIAWQHLLSDGRVRSDLKGVGSPSEADIALFHHELHMAEVEFQIWVALGTVVPDYVLTHAGVPIVSVYKRK